jgi:hypothetical protein
MNNADEVSQAERRRIMREDRLARNTYFSHANDPELEMGGRFAKVIETTVIGKSPISYPQQPPGSPWASDPMPPEPSLGYSVEAQEPVGERHEIEASAVPIAEDGPAAAQEPSHVITAVAAGSKFRRRF